MSEVDLESASTHLAGTLTRINLVASAGHPKTARSRRRVKVGALAVDALREHRRRQVDQRLRAGTVWVDRDRVLSGSAGGHLHPDKLNRELRSVLTVAGLSVIWFHNLRHTTATLLLGREVNPKKV